MYEGMHWWFDYVARAELDKRSLHSTHTINQVIPQESVVRADKREAG